MKSLTPAQSRVLSVFRDLLEATGGSPTVRDVAARLGLGVATVQEHLTALVRSGRLTQKAGHRGLALREASAGRAVPIVGRVPAGTPLLAEEHVEGTVTVDRDLARRGKVFALRVRGDSMKEAGILDGDLVIVRQQAAADPGAIVVARLGDEATVKRLRVVHGRPVLEPANPKYKPIPAETAEILGMVVGLVRGV